MNGSADRAIWESEAFRERNASGEEQAVITTTDEDGRVHHDLIPVRLVHYLIPEAEVFCRTDEKQTKTREGIT